MNLSAESPLWQWEKLIGELSGKFSKLLIMATLGALLSQVVCGAVESSATELALFEEIPSVFTQDKKIRLITESPAPIYYNTQNDFKKSVPIKKSPARRK